MEDKRNLKNAEIDKSLLESVEKNIESNKRIIQYYKKFKNESSIAFKRDGIENKIERIKFCNKLWIMNKYNNLKIKDFVKTSLCHDKFCSNCKKVMQAGRMVRYIPELNIYKKNMYHLILTVPNVSGNELRFTIKKMNRAFKSIIKLLNGSKKIKGIDFSNFNYLGAVRSLEVTFKRDNYHPHFHVAIVLENFKESKKKYINDFSFNYGNFSTLFSSEEVLIQKLFYLYYNNIKVTKEKIDNLKQGYSCKLLKFREEDYAELFKYMCKNTDEDGKILKYENFSCLYYSLYKIKQIQGYGCLYNIKSEEDLTSCENEYEKLIEFLNESESPERDINKVRDLINETEYKLISRKTFFKYLKEDDKIDKTFSNENN